MGQGTRACDSGGLRAAELCAGGGLPVRLEPRSRPAEWRDGDRKGRPCPALPQPDAVRAGLSARDGRKVFDAYNRALLCSRVPAGAASPSNMKTAVETVLPASVSSTIAAFSRSPATI